MEKRDGEHFEEKNTIKESKTKNKDITGFSEEKEDIAREGAIGEQIILSQLTPKKVKSRKKKTVTVFAKAGE